MTARPFVMGLSNIQFCLLYSIFSLMSIMNSLRLHIINIILKNFANISHNSEFFRLHFKIYYFYCNKPPACDIISIIT